MKCADSQLPTEPARQVPSASVFSKREALGVALALCSLGAIVLVGHAAGITFCLFRRVTGFPCPCCGTTRACLSLLRGDVVGAIAYNPLAVLLVFLGPVALWLMTLRRGWPRSVVVTVTALAWGAVLLNWAYLLYRDMSQG